MLQKYIDICKEETGVDLAVTDIKGNMIAGTYASDKELPKKYTETPDGRYRVYASGKGADTAAVMLSGWIQIRNALMDEEGAVDETEAFWLRLMKETVRRNASEEEAAGMQRLTEEYGRGAEKIGIDPEVKRIVYLLEIGKGQNNTELNSAAVELLKQMSPDPGKSSIVHGEDGLLIVIREVGGKLSGKKEISQYRIWAEEYVSMINTELMEKVSVAYGNPSETLPEVACSYREALEALNVMGKYYEERTIASYAALDVGGLFYHVPEEIQRRFLREIFGEKETVTLSEKELQMVVKFFEKDLNLTEAAKDLYMHRNTLAYHLKKVQDKTGLDIRKFDDAQKLKLAMMLKI